MPSPPVCACMGMPQILPLPLPYHSDRSKGRQAANKHLIVWLADIHTQPVVTTSYHASNSLLTTAASPSPPTSRLFPALSSSHIPNFFPPQTFNVFTLNKCINV